MERDYNQFSNRENGEHRRSLDVPSALLVIPCMLGVMLIGSGLGWWAVAAGLATMIWVVFIIEKNRRASREKLEAFQSQKSDEKPLKITPHNNL